MATYNGLLAAVGGVLIAGVVSGGVAAQSVTLSYATNTAPNNLRGEAESIFLEELASASNGAIDVVPYWGSSLMAGPEILGGVRDGVADMGFVNLNYYPNQLLLNSSLNLFPKGPTDYEDIAWAFEQAYEQVPELGDEFAGHGQRIIYRYGVTPYAGVFTTPVDALDDFDGLRIRAASRWYLNLLGGAGATPVSVPWADLYQALQTGSIDGVFTNIDGIHRASLDEAAPNVFVMEELWLATPFILTINEAKWQGLEPELQEAFGRAAQAAQARYAEIYGDAVDRIIAAQTEAGYTVTMATGEEIETFANLPEVEANRAMWIEEASAAGVEDPRAIIEAVGSVIDQALER